VRVGEPILFNAGMSADEITARLRESVRAL